MSPADLSTLRLSIAESALETAEFARKCRNYAASARWIATARHNLRECERMLCAPAPRARARKTTGGAP